MNSSPMPRLALLYLLFLVHALALGAGAHAHTTESFHTCCDRTLDHIIDARQTNLPACNVAHKVLDSSCDAGCCFVRALFDPCPGIIGCPGDDCPVEFDLPESQCADGDGDGLLDTWETNGLDVDNDSVVDIDLPAMGADPMHKDLFVELDWMSSGDAQPTQPMIDEWKRAFCAAPGSSGGTVNPDASQGITLWVDTGSITGFGLDGRETSVGPCSCGDGADNDGNGLIDDLDSSCLAFAPDFGEDGGGPWTCNDGIDNGSADGSDQQDPDCLVFDWTRTETDLAIGTCLDGIDNDDDGMFDTFDPDCKVGDDFGGGNSVDASDVSGLTSAFYAIKTANFDPNRALVFRYGLSARPARNNDGTSSGGNGATTLNDTAQSWLADEWAERPVEITSGMGSGQVRTILSNTATQLTVDSNWSTTPNSTSEYEIGLVGGMGERGGNDFVDFNHNADTLMHELGHNLNLGHGGDEERNCKPNYVSIMNYDHQPGIPQPGGVGGQDLDGDGIGDGVIIDFSPPRYHVPAGMGRAPAPFQSLVEMTLSEGVVLAGNDRANRMIFVNADGAKVTAAVNGDFDSDGPGDGNGNMLGDGVDWDDSGDTMGSGLAVNIDTSSMGGTPVDCTNTLIDTNAMTGYDDWANISLGFGHFGDAAAAPVNLVTTPEPTLSELAQIRTRRNITDLALAMSAMPIPVEVGDELTFQMDMSNQGPNPASRPVVVNALSENSAYVQADASCEQGPADTITCRSPEVSVRTARQVGMTVDTANVCVQGIPTPIVASAQVANQAQLPELDPTQADNAVDLSVTPQDTTPPTIEHVSVTPTALWPPNHKMVPVEVEAVATDICDDMPVCLIESVASNEAVDGLGDGNHSPDWTITGAFSADLRAERSGNGSGREYSLTIRCSDASNNSAFADVTVTVAHDKR